jgi:hypothetical protein
MKVARNDVLVRCAGLWLLVGAVAAQAPEDPWVLRAHIITTLEKRVALSEQTAQLLRQNFDSIQLKKDATTTDLDVARAAIARLEAEGRTLKLRLELADAQLRCGRTVDEKAVDGFLTQQLSCAREVVAALVRVRTLIDTEYQAGRRTFQDLVAASTELAAAEDHVLCVQQNIDERSLARAEQRAKNGK